MGNATVERALYFLMLQLLSDVPEFWKLLLIDGKI